ncbi:MAG: galactose mutarotase [Propionibacteriaceae bacterium]|jgi:aldose 1-epimerase|nr:galactose mutarotase [Propionibacteriaceae bacterium]
MDRVTLAAGDLTAEIWTLGACVNNLIAPDRSGNLDSIVLGYASEADRRAGESYLGEIVGPFANRIAAGGYRIDGQQFTPALNDSGSSTLHGGPTGISTHDWTILEQAPDSVQLHLDWEDPSSGFAGPIHIDIEYLLSGDGLRHAVTAKSEAPVPLSIVSHPYFNLAGSTCATIGEHRLTVPASVYLPIDQASIPLADAPQPTAGTPFDFTVSRDLRSAFGSADPQVSAHGGVDHALIVDGQGWRQAAQLDCPGTGRRLSIWTDYPAIQVYTGQFLDSTTISHPHGCGGRYSGVALETEEYPDAPRRADFPNTVVRPGQLYQRQTSWLLSTDASDLS